MRKEQVECRNRHLVKSFQQLSFLPHVLGKQQRSVVSSVLLRLLCCKVFQLSLVRIFQCWKASLVNLECEHQVDDPLQEYGLLVVVALKSDEKT